MRDRAVLVVIVDIVVTGHILDFRHMVVCARSMRDSTVLVVIIVVADRRRIFTKYSAG